MIAIIDYGVGNLFSLTASLKHLEAETIVTASIAGTNVTAEVKVVVDPNARNIVAFHFRPPFCFSGIIYNII